MIKIAILTIFRDEAHILYEWCKYHLDFGFDHLYMINNQSQDDFNLIIDELNTDKITIFNEPGYKIQEVALQKYYGKIRHLYDWIYICDLDEFIYFNDSNQYLDQFLDNQPNDIQSITINWKIFQPSHFNCPNSVIENNIIWCKNALGSNLNKSIIRTCISPDKIHHHQPKIPYTQIKLFRPIDNIIQINHYRYNSWEFMLGLKLSRGGACTGKYRWYNRQFIQNPKLGLKLNFDPHSNCIDNTLKSKCQELIQDLNQRQSNKPKTSIYNNQLYHRIKQYLLQHDIKNPKLQLNDILKFNQRIIFLLKNK
jgi:hypothetical protein